MTMGLSRRVHDGRAPVSEKMLELAQTGNVDRRRAGLGTIMTSQACERPSWAIWQRMLHRWFARGVAAAMLKGQPHARMRKHAFSSHRRTGMS